MGIEIAELYQALDRTSEVADCTRNWAAMQALQAKIATDTELQQIVDKYGIDPVVVAVLDQVEVLGLNDGISPHYLVASLQFCISENASVVVVRKNNEDLG